MKKKSWVGIISIGIMVIISSFFYLNFKGMRQSLEYKGYDNIEVKETMYQKENDVNELRSFSASIRNYMFEVSKVSFSFNKKYIVVDLMITNNYSEEKTMGLNSISLVNIDTEGNEIDRISVKYVNNPEEEISAPDYYHYTIASGECSAVRLYFIADTLDYGDGCKVALHFNPFGTEGSVIRGKKQNGEIVEFIDTDNVADIYIESLLKGAE